MTVLTKKDLEEGKRLSELRRDDKENAALCSCGRSIRRCTVAQKFTLPREKGSKKEEEKHADLSYEQIQQKYFDWLVLHGYLLIEHGLDTIG